MPSTTLEPGLRIGKYEVVAHVASGGMGAVYKAIDRELDRPVALKVMSARVAENRRGLDRFKREARNAAKLSHPNIVTLYDCDYDEAHDLHFLAMEFVEGIDLSEHIRRKGQLTPEETRRILIQAVKALDHAFRQGVIHRDIKPSNFLLTRLGDKAVVKLTDMGLAVRNDDDEQRVTGDGNTVGTLDYMSPEQARDSRSADVRSDIYSLGCTAYHMLAGKPPFPDGGVGERLYKHMNIAPTDVREFNPAVSADFWAIIEKMLAKEPNDRYAMPAELLGSLKRTSTEASPDAPTMIDVATRRKTDVELVPEPLTYQAAPRPVPPPPPTLQRKVKAPEPPSSEVQVAVSPREKRPRPRKLPHQMKVVFGVIAGLCFLVIGGPLLLQFLRSMASPGVEAPAKKTINSGIDPGHNSIVVVAEPNEIRPKDTRSNPDPPPRPIDPIPLPKDTTPPFKDTPAKVGERPSRNAMIPYAAIAPLEKLDQIKAVQLKGKIRPIIYPEPIKGEKDKDFTLAWEGFTRVKYEDKWTVLLIGSGHGFTTVPGFLKTLTGDALDYYQNHYYATMVSDLIVLNEKGFETEKAEASQVRKKDCFTLLVKRSGRPTLKLHFETETKLLCKIEFQTKILDKTTLKYPPIMTQVELYFSDYQQFGPIKHWRKQETWRNEVQQSELLVTEVKTYTSVEDAPFAAPGLEAEVYAALVRDKTNMIANVVYQLGGDENQSDFCRLVHGLSHKDVARRPSAREALIAYGELWPNYKRIEPKDADCLITLLRLDDDAELRAFAIRAVPALGKNAVKAVPTLKELVRLSGDPGVVSGALISIGRSGAKNETSFCETYLDHANLLVKDAAALALLRLGPDRLSAEQLTEFMTRSNGNLRAEAAQVLLPRLAKLTPKDVSLLEEGVRHDSTEVQITFIDFIGSLKEPGEPLAVLLGKRLQFKGNQEVALHSITALENMGKAGAKALADLTRAMEGTDKTLSVAAAIAICKIDPPDVVLKSQAMKVLIDDVTPDPADLRNLTARSLKSRSATTLMELGEPAIVPVVQNLLNRHDPVRMLVNEQIGPTATRWVGYEFLKEFARRAKATEDKAMVQSLQKEGKTLSKYWVLQEDRLAKKSTFTNMLPEARQVYAAALESARQAQSAISALKLPSKLP